VGFSAFARGDSAVALRRGLLALAGAALLAVLLSAPQLLPALELAELSSRRIDTLDIDLADPHYRRTSAVNLILQTILPVRDRPFQFLLMTPTAGWVVLALVAAAPFNRRQRRAAGFFAIVALGTYLIGLGRHTPLYGLYFGLPTSTLFRIAARFFALTALPLAMLAGIGVDALWRTNGRPRVAIGALAFLAALAAALTLALHFGADAIAGAGILASDMLEPGLLSRLRAAASI
jgi:hypothetical protein